MKMQDYALQGLYGHLVPESVEEPHYGQKFMSACGKDVEWRGGKSKRFICGRCVNVMRKRMSDNVHSLEQLTERHRTLQAGHRSLTQISEEQRRRTTEQADKIRQLESEIVRPLPVTESWQRASNAAIMDLNDGLDKRKRQQIREDEYGETMVLNGLLEPIIRLGDQAVRK